MTQEFDPSGEGVRVNDKRRIDPDTYEVRRTSSGEPQSELIVEATAVESDSHGVDASAGDKIAELTGDLQRVQAEYANYRKRIERDWEANRQSAIGSVFVELLPVLDDVDRAREHGELSGAFKTMGETLEASLTKMGLEKFGAANEPFDPNVHEALASEEVEGVTEPTVIAVFQPGYRQGERILRPARVSVAGT